MQQLQFNGKGFVLIQIAVLGQDSDAFSKPDSWKLFFSY